MRGAGCGHFRRRARTAAAWPQSDLLEESPPESDRRRVLVVPSPTFARVRGRSKRYSTIKFFCGSCVSQGFHGGEIYISYLEAEGHYAEMDAMPDSDNYGGYAKKAAAPPPRPPLHALLHFLVLFSRRLRPLLRAAVAAGLLPRHHLA